MSDRHASLLVCVMCLVFACQLCHVEKLPIHMRHLLPIDSLMRLSVFVHAHMHICVCVNI